ncbi:MAG: radical SAM protein [Thermoanaerobaculia bacterium]|nr:radical SAM protein [Thermoanaerobaculia bacterium]
MRLLLAYHNPSREMTPAPPVGMAYVATAAAAAGHEVAFVDLAGERRPASALALALAAHRPEVVGFSVRNIDNVIRQRTERELDAQRELIATVRAWGPARIVVGGPAVSLLGARALVRLDADFAVLGEGEETVPELLAALAAARSPAEVPGIAWRDGETLRTTPPRRLAAFGASGLENWVDWRPYERRGHTWPIQTKRGCPLGCTYCSYPLLEGAAVRRRDPVEVVDEIERVARRWRPRTFEIIDSVLNEPRDHLLALCRELARRRLGVGLTAMGVSPRHTDEELFAALREAGFRSLMISPESASDPVLAAMRKGFAREDLVRTARLARDSGLACCWFFLLGAPGESRETVEETLSFVEQELASPRFLTIVFTGVRLLPGTALTRAEQAAGRLAPDHDFSEPTFYLSPDLDEAWALQRVNRTIARLPNVVHSAEGTASSWQRLLERTALALGLRPPVWRLYPRYLALPPIAYLRRLFPDVGAPV